VLLTEKNVGIVFSKLVKKLHSLTAFSNGKWCYILSWC